MASRDIWSRGGPDTLSDLLAGALASLLLHPKGDDPVYFSSPWMSDFPLFANHFRQFSGLFPERAEDPVLTFAEYLVTLSRRRPVRVITVREHKVSARFSSHRRFDAGERLSVRFAEEAYHEKGILSPLFYLEGSMNLTYSGVYVRDEKVVFHSAGDGLGSEKVARARLEFDRLWEGLA